MGVIDAGIIDDDKLKIIGITVLGYRYQAAFQRSLSVSSSWNDQTYRRGTLFGMFIGDWCRFWLYLFVRTAFRFIRLWLVWNWGTCGILLILFSSVAVRS